MDPKEKRRSVYTSYAEMMKSIPTGDKTKKEWSAMYAIACPSIPIEVSRAKERRINSKTAIKGRRELCPSVLNI